MNDNPTDRAEMERLMRTLVLLRNKAGLSQYRLARIMGAGQSTVCQMETLHHCNPSVAMLQRYARALGMRLTFTVEPQQPTDDPCPDADE